MLEFYTKQLEELASQTAQLIQNIRTTQDIIKINLDSQRNSVLIMEAKVVMASLGVTSGTLVAGFFGMNLTSGLESHPTAFFITTSAIVFCSAGMIAILLRKLRRVVHTE